jgi:hypothetical protein
VASRPHDQRSLTIGPRGSTLLEDFHFLEKITHFGHERIPERIDAGVIDVGASGNAVADFIAAAKRGRVWAREAAAPGGDPALAPPAGGPAPTQPPTQP